MKIAVVGSGYYGSLIALSLLDHADITLIEQSDTLCSGASSINQSRLHEGYHYPRSTETANEIRESNTLFKKKYGSDFLINSDNYYAISKADSKSNDDDFENFCFKNKLPIEKVYLDIFNYKNVSSSYKVQETILNNDLIRTSIIKDLFNSNIKIKLNHKFTYNDLDKFDKVILCTYGNDYEITKTPKYTYRFQVVEKMKILLPQKFRNKSVVVIDGPFFCFDPTIERDTFMIGSVKHANHSENIGLECEIPNYLKNHINKKSYNYKDITNFNNIISSAKKYIPDFKDAKYVSSQFVVRSVLAYSEKTDERLSSITQIDNKIYSVHSGKISSSVIIANKIKNKIFN